MKKLFALVLALLMVASLGITAFAANSTTDPVGSITINDVSAATTYEIYKLLKLESYDTESGAYAYQASDEWQAFFQTEEAKKYLSTDADGYVTWIASEDDDTKATFAKGALSYAKAHGITPVQSSKNEGQFVITGTSGKFSGLDLGWYLVDSTMGALCGLTTTNPDASINAKNGIPTIEKQVQEDSTSQWGKTDTADIGQVIPFRITINVHAGAQNYVLHDILPEGLSFQEVTRIEHIVPGTSTDDDTVDTSKYSVSTRVAHDNGTETTDDDFTCSYDVTFTKDFCDDLETNDKIVVYYSAMLNRNAVIAGAGNVNTAWLTFGEGGKSNEDHTTTYTYGIDIIKTDSQNTLIDGAKFKIYDAEKDGNEVAVVLMDDGVTYRRARADETGDEIVVNNGQVRVVGFDNGTYYLEETEAPDGYNKLTARQKFIISDANLYATFNSDIYSTGSGVHVVNKTGSMLPETGAMGTTLFIVFGMTVALATGVLLVTKKRMSMIEE